MLVDGPVASLGLFAGKVDADVFCEGKGATVPMSLQCRGSPTGRRSWPSARASWASGPSPSTLGYAGLVTTIAINDAMG
jgi:hypothetical protein